MDPSDRVPACFICTKSIISKPKCKDEEARVLTCDHIFHSECIGEWAKRQMEYQAYAECPKCLEPLDFFTPNFEETKKILDDPTRQLLHKPSLRSAQETIIQKRHFRKLDIRKFNSDERSEMAYIASTVYSIAINGREIL